MLVLLIILIVAIAAVLIIGYALGLFTIEKVVVDEKPDISLEGEGEDKYGVEDAELAPGEDEEDLSLKEKMELNGYFSEEEKGAGGSGESSGDKEADPDEVRFAQYDRLCDFKVGRGYLIECQRALDQAKVNSEIYAAAYFDFDRFRFINSLKGMSIGDYVLTRMSQDLLEVFPLGSCITRISADHFAAVFPMTGQDMFDICAERLRDLCEKLRGDIAIKSGLRACMGVAVTENLERDYDISVLLHKANIARHCIKFSRSETWKQFEDSMITTYLYGESALEDYSENQYDEEFVIYYVPQQEISMRNTVGAEALVRWSCENDATKSIPPSMNKSKIPTNSSKVVYHVCKAISRWRKSGKQLLPVSVPIPITEFYKEDLDEFIGRCLSEFQLAPADLVLVVEASMIRVDWSAASRQIKKLRDIGVQVGVDEIDLGYSSLEFLHGLPLAYIKLHRSFCGDIEQNQERQQAVKNMLEQAKSQQLRVILEGVDTQEQADTLRELGAKEFQGVYCGRPLVSEEFVRGLSDYVEKNYSRDTVILDDASLRKGDFNLY